MSLLQSFLSTLILGSLFLMNVEASAMNNRDEQHLEVALRMIGHQMLLNSGDSTSLVLPIQKEGDRYKIRFGSDLEFEPDELARTVSTIVEKTEIAHSYIVEVESCESGEVVYSFEIDSRTPDVLMPCLGRPQPKGCYSLLFTVLDGPVVDNPVDASKEDQVVKTRSDSKLNFAVIVIFLTLAAVVLFFLRRIKNKPEADPHVISLGEFRFDKRNTELIFRDERIELTSKEADLLALLHDGANSTVKREVILNRVWGDEGDYVGRTLDVFISKLRKKLEADRNLKIVNIRGIGYKLVLNN